MAGIGRFGAQVTWMEVKEFKAAEPSTVTLVLARESVSWFISLL